MSAKDAMKAPMDALMRSFRCCVFPYILCSASTVSRLTPLGRLAASEGCFRGLNHCPRHSHARTHMHTHTQPSALGMARDEVCKEEDPNGPPRWQADNVCNRCNKPTTCATGATSRQQVQQVQQVQVYIQVLSK